MNSYSPQNWLERPELHREDEELEGHDLIHAEGLLDLPPVNRFYPAYFTSPDPVSGFTQEVY